MSDRLIEENDVSIDEVKVQAIAKHMSDIKVMEKCIFGLDQFIIRFGRESNAHDLAFDLKLQILQNKKHLEEWINTI